jgi:FMN phosphatase YigB (HAD superfamily)
MSIDLNKQAILTGVDLSTKAPATLLRLWFRAGVRAVFFDVGETLIDETRHWAGWAEWLGVPLLTFFAALGGVIERGEHHRHVFELVRPGLDLDSAREQRSRAGGKPRFEPRDLYPDAIPCLERMRAGGYRIGLAGNQPAWAEQALRALGVQADHFASSESWGVEKPSPAFFERIIALAGLPPEQIAYVGDRLDNDVLPARAAGMVAVFLRRGPWGIAHALRPEAQAAHLRLDSLDELPAALERLYAARAQPR